MLNFWQLLVVSFALNSLVMVGVWLVAKRINNFGIVDIVWSWSFPLTAVTFYFLAPGWPLRKLLITAMVAIWGLRLGFFLFKRIKAHHPVEDSRYAHLREEYGKKFGIRFFWFYQYQAWSIAILSLPFLEASVNPAEGLSRLELVGIIVWLIGIGGESLADHQMNGFKKDPANKGKVGEVGLWKYSRHPNYFFESVIWWGYFIFAAGTSGAIYTVFAPLVMLFLLLKVTGVPASEQQSLKSRGEAYRDYQRRVSVFVPWFPAPKIKKDA